MSKISLKKAEELLCRRRNEEDLKREHWNGITQYFKNWERVGHKFGSWTSDTYYNQIEHVQNDVRKENEYKAKLEARREKLRNKLMAEKIQYEIELKEFSTKKKFPETDFNQVPLSQLQNVNIELHRRQQEALRKQSELKQYLAWKANNPKLVEFNRKQNTNFVKRSWVEQILEKQRQRELEEREKAREELERLKLLQIEQERDRAEQEQRKKEVVQLKEELLRQMELLRIEEEKSDALKLEEAKELQLQREVENILIQREVDEKKRRAQEYGLFLTKQYQLKLRRRARQVQEQMLEDQALLNNFEFRIQNEIGVDETLKQNVRQEMDKTNLILSQLLERERKREKEMEFIFQEDAKSLWEKQEAKWNAEREARNNLLNQVLNSIKQQISFKLEQNMEAQRRLVEEREELLKNVEIANEEYAKKEKEIEEARKEWKTDIEAQMIEKEMLQKEEKLKEEEEREREKQRQLEEENKLVAELEKLRSIPYTPTHFSRRRIVW